MQIKTWEIELLADKRKELGMTLRDAMMDLRHPTTINSTCFTPSINISGENAIFDGASIGRIQVHAMIAAMLPYLLWHHAQSQLGPKASA